jgi:hypothetical protein
MTFGHAVLIADLEEAVLILLVSDDQINESQSNSEDLV